jgi:predicted phosphodiesterase
MTIQAPIIVVLSDIHIGTNTPTVWYQKDFHQPYLKAIFDWVIKNASNIQELVLLGDVIDFWTYPMEEQPPSFDDIAAANPEIFGSNGVLSQVLTALKGKVTYVRGNHDMSITQADLDKIQNPNYKIHLCPNDIYYPLGNGNKRIVCTHGHIFTMFNAPYTNNNPVAPIPVGYYVPRAIATWRSQQIKDRVFPSITNVSQLNDSGDPDGMKTLLIEAAIVDAVKSGTGASIARILLDSVTAKTGINDQQQIKLANGNITTFAEAKQRYQNLFAEWVQREGGGRDGELVAFKAVLADADGSYMGWFAQRLALTVGADLVVMGHTHTPISGLSDSCIQYVNTGFNCPSIPDTGRKHPTFITINTDSCKAEVLQVAKEGSSYNITPCSPPPTVDKVDYTPSPGGNFSCYIEIDLPYDLIRESYGITKSTLPPGQDCGHYIVPPPERINAGESGRFWIQDYPGAHGAEGWVEYSYNLPSVGKKVLRFEYGCPTGVYDNYFRVSGSGSEAIAFEVWTKVGDTTKDWSRGIIKNPFPLPNHPFQVRVVTVASFRSIYKGGAGIGGWDLASPADQAFAFDYNSAGKLDHLVIYRL